MFRSIFNPTHHSIHVSLVVLAIQTVFVQKRCGEKLGFPFGPFLAENSTYLLFCTCKYCNTNTTNLFCVREEEYREESLSRGVSREESLSRGVSREESLSRGVSRREVSLSRGVSLARRVSCEESLSRGVSRGVSLGRSLSRGVSLARSLSREESLARSLSRKVSLSRGVSLAGSLSRGVSLVRSHWASIRSIQRGGMP